MAWESKEALPNVQDGNDTTSERPEDAAITELGSFIRDCQDPFVTKMMARDLNAKGLPRTCIVIADILPLVILWINFRSTVGYQALISQVALILVITYFMVCACSFDARVYRPDLLGHARGGFWRPGFLLGAVMDICAMVFLFVVGLVSCLPFAPHPNAAGWNYAPFMVLAVILIGIVVWFLTARKHYHPGQRA